MFFKKIAPGRELESFIECYWVIESENKIPFAKKIIPDGFPEIVFHYKDPYRINNKGHWETQPASLFAGQIRKHFFLENTGASGVFGIKFKPAAITHLLNISMQDFTDKVVGISELKNNCLDNLEKEMLKGTDTETRVQIAEKEMQAWVKNITTPNEIINNAIKQILERQGNIPVTEMRKNLFVSERVLQRLFLKYIGLSPKIYARIIRFNFIFQLIENGETTWADLAYDSGYFDQSHLIKNFKSFTGEEPSGYSFIEENIANFFLNKK
jgi:AraC-like DNA-binding protein